MSTDSYGIPIADAGYVYNDEVIKPSLEPVDPEIRKDIFYKKLIKLVKKYPILYSSTSIKNRGKVKERLRKWKKISKQMYVDVEDCKYHWNRLRMTLVRMISLHSDQVIKGIKSTDSDPDWKYYKQLEFILPHTKKYQGKARDAALVLKEQQVLETIEIDDDDEESQNTVKSESKEKQIEVEIANVTCDQENKESIETNDIKIEFDKADVKSENDKFEVEIEFDNTNVKTESVSGDTHMENSTADTDAKVHEENSNIEDKNVSEIQDTCEMDTDLIDYEESNNAVLHLQDDSYKIYDEKPTNTDHDRIESDEDKTSNNDQNEECEMKTGNSELQNPINSTDTVNEVTIENEMINETVEIDDECEGKEIIKEDEVASDESSKTDGKHENTDKPSSIDDDDESNQQTSCDDESCDATNINSDANRIINENLIAAIKEHPILFRMDGRSARAEKSEAWINVSERLDLSVPDCKFRWEVLKRQLLSGLKYRLQQRKHKPITKDKKKLRWLVKHMQFFLPYTKTKFDCPARLAALVNEVQCTSEEESSNSESEKLEDGKGNDEQKMDEMTWSDDEAEDFVLKTYISSVLKQTETRQKNRHAVDVEDELSYYTNFFS